MMTAIDLILDDGVGCPRCGFLPCVCDYLDGMDGKADEGLAMFRIYFHRPWPHLAVAGDPCPCLQCESMRRAVG